MSGAELFGHYVSGETMNAGRNEEDRISASTKVFEAILYTPHGPGDIPSSVGFYSNMEAAVKAAKEAALEKFDTDDSYYWSVNPVEVKEKADD